MVVLEKCFIEGCQGTAEATSFVDYDAHCAVSPLRFRNAGDEVTFKTKGVVLPESRFIEICHGAAEAISLVNYDAHCAVSLPSGSKSRK